MLDGSITPFKVRSSITIASLKAKFEPWQPMKGRALLHHDVRLDDRATLSSIPGIKNGTILRVDQHVSQAKKKSTGKKCVMSGPASLGMDEDVVESIEMSGDDVETSSEDERRISGSKRKRPSRTSSAAREDIIDNDSTVISLRRRGVVSDDLRGDPLNMTGTISTDSPLALRTVKKEKLVTTAREHTIASEAERLVQRPYALPNAFPPPQEDEPAGNATASIHFPTRTAPISSPRNSMDLDDASFLAGIKAAAATETARPPLRSENRPEEHVPAHRCNACGRACRCDRGSSTTSNGVVPALIERIQGGETLFTDGDGSGHRVAREISRTQLAESGWTGM